MDTQAWTVSVRSYNIHYEETDKNRQVYELAFSQFLIMGVLYQEETGER